MPSKVISKTVKSCVIKETCLSVCLKSCKLKKSCTLTRVPSDTAECFMSCQNNQTDSTVTIFTSDEVQNNDCYGPEFELTSDTLVFSKSMMQDDIHQSKESKDTSGSYLTTDDDTSTNCDGLYGFEVTHEDAGNDSTMKVLQFGGCEDHAKRADGGDFCESLSNDGQSRNNDRSGININFDNVATQDHLLQVDEGALIFPVHEEKPDIMSFTYTDLSSEILTNSNDLWLGLNLQLDVNQLEDNFEPFFLDSECTATLDSDFFNDLPSLLDSECPTWFLSSPTAISSDKPVTLVLDMDETLVHSSVTPSDRTDFSVQLDERTLYVQKRPFLHSFLEKVSALFQIIIFTAGTRKYADLVLDVLDPERRVTSRRAYRDSCVFSSNGSYKKDLTILGVDLAKLAIVDNTPAVFHELQVNNGIPIKSWIGDRSDEELILLLPFLETLAHADDVRPFIAEKFNMKH